MFSISLRHQLMRLVGPVSWQENRLTPSRFDVVDPLSTGGEIYRAVAETANLVGLILDGGCSVYTVRISTDAAPQILVTENVEIAEYMLRSATVFAVELQFVAQILTGAQADGLTVEPAFAVDEDNI